MTSGGRVLVFDVHRGRGTVVAPDGTRLGFHCTQIADGSRDVPVDAQVRYEVAAGPLGCWEAVSIDVV